MALRRLLIYYSRPVCACLHAQHIKQNKKAKLEVINNKFIKLFQANRA